MEVGWRLRVCVRSLATANCSQLPIQDNNSKSLMTVSLRSNLDMKFAWRWYVMNPEVLS